LAGIEPAFFLLECLSGLKGSASMTSNAS